MALTIYTTTYYVYLSLSKGIDSVYLSVTKIKIYYYFPINTMLYFPIKTILWLPIRYMLNHKVFLWQTNISLYGELTKNSFHYQIPYPFFRNQDSSQDGSHNLDSHLHCLSIIVLIALQLLQERAFKPSFIRPLREGFIRFLLSNDHYNNKCKNFVLHLT